RRRSGSKTQEPNGLTNRYKRETRSETEYDSESNHACISNVVTNAFEVPNKDEGSEGEAYCEKDGQWVLKLGRIRPKSQRPARFHREPNDGNGNIVAPPAWP